MEHVKLELVQSGLQPAFANEHQRPALGALQLELHTAGVPPRRGALHRLEKHVEQSQRVRRELAPLGYRPVLAALGAAGGSGGSGSYIPKRNALAL
jgi:hypothetical protein